MADGSHDLEPLERLSSRAIWVAGGEIAADGAPADVIARHLSRLTQGPIRP